MVKDFAVALTLCLLGNLGNAATLNVLETTFGEFPNAVASNNPVIGQVDVGPNMISGRLTGHCTTGFGGWVDCNQGVWDSQDSFAVAVPAALFLHRATLNWAGTAPDGFRLVLNVRDLANGTSSLIGAPSGQAALSDFMISDGPAHLSVMAGSATAAGTFDVTWEIAATAAVPLPSGLAFALTALGALTLVSRSATARRAAPATR